MYLKSLKLVGFKSFADRTHLEFRPGVTVVVGPNGSGKSNLVDALSWVMGSQSTKALRTGKMEDVVFAGTATRPALNRAEATLVIDNEQRKIPLDLDEVSITRRLYRDGSSDYEINGVGCRLLDVQELLSDSGIGRNQHVIIGQGEVDKVLNASPEEHRSIIEDAAGILKHRRRKEKAERRLHKTDDDLIRLQDLVRELERQMRPLKRQARAAQRYDGIKAEVADLRLYLAREVLQALDGELKALNAEKEDLSAKIATGEARVASQSSLLADTTTQAERVGRDLEKDTAAAARIETSIERLRRLGSVANERVRAATGRREAVVERTEDLEREKESIASELDKIHGLASEATRVAAVREREFRQLEDEERAMATQASLSPEGAAAALRGELSVLKAADIRDEREEAAIGKRLAVVDAQVLDETTEVDRINEEVKTIDERLSELSVAYESATDTRQLDQEVWDDAAEELTEVRLDQAAAKARVEAIEATLEGSIDPEALRKLEGTAGSMGSVISRLDVPGGLERAVESALGGWVGAIVFARGEELATAVEDVKSAGLGGVGVVTGSEDARAIATQVAIESGVDALVEKLGPRADRELAAVLLGDVLLVEGWQSAWRLVGKHNNLRAVTPEGDLVSPHGVYLAHPESAGPAMLEAAIASLDEVATSVARAESLHATAKRDFEKSREAERAALVALESAEAALSGKSEAMARLVQSVDVLREEQERLAQRRISLAEGIAARKRQSGSLAERLEALEGEEAARMEAWSEMEAQRIDVAARREVARASWQEAATEAETLSERRRMLSERVGRIEADLATIDDSGVGQFDVAALTEVVRHSKRSIEVLGRRLEELRERQHQLRDENSRVLGELTALREENESALARLTDARERVSRIEVRLTEITFRRESVVEEVRRDADADIDAAAHAERPDYDDDTDLNLVLEEKLATLRRLGPINPLAASEFEALEERHEFLTSQLADIESSRNELRKVIAALDREIQERFQEAFTEVAAAYETYFGVLFPGGRGRIRAVDPDHPETGLVIDAQPLGKKLSTLSLLSGGERSLAALAFLFAVFEARPSPFYVLDEVEAALDDSNLARFIRIVDEFRERAQLLIVTHQQQTMESADVLYGITMEPGGASQAVRKEMSSTVSATRGVDRVA